jgi:uncharacterized damage-inducible protein DinB
MRSRLGLSSDTLVLWVARIAGCPGYSLERQVNEGAQMTEPADDRPRVRPTYVLDERELLDGWLGFHRSTLSVKCEGLDDGQRKARPIPTSDLSLHGLVRHMAETERNWFGRILQRDQTIPQVWPDAATKSPFLATDAADWNADLDAWRSECRTSSDVASRYDLDATGEWREKEVSLKSIYLHMIQEYARHNGQADLIRELLDGSVGL